MSVIRIVMILLSPIGNNSNQKGERGKKVAVTESGNDNKCNKQFGN